MALTLQKIGYSQVYALKGGWQEWQDKGYPVAAK